jgi:hypothetical protein
MTPKQEAALREYLQEAIVPLIEDVLAKKLGQAMTFAAQELIQPKREWVGLDLAEMDAIIDGNMTITDSKLRDAVYAVVIDTMTTLMEKNHG